MPIQYNIVRALGRKFTFATDSDEDHIQNIIRVAARFMSWMNLNSLLRLPVRLSA